MSNIQETFKQIKEAYECLKVGQAMYVQAPGISSARVVSVGRKWIHLAGGRKIEARDVWDWWGDN